MPSKISSSDAWPKCHEPGIYRIRVVGKLGPEWAERFEGIELVTERQADGTVTTDLSGPIADQSALVGLIDQLATVGANLVKVEFLRSVPPAGAGSGKGTKGERK